MEEQTRKQNSSRPSSRKDEVERALDSVRPLLAIHRGNVDLVDFDENSGVVSVRLTGTCQGCPLSELTLKAGIEEVLKEQVAGVSRVEAVK